LYQKHIKQLFTKRTLTLLVFLLCIAIVHAQKPVDKRKELEQKRIELQKRIEQTKKALEQTEKQKKASLGNLNIINSQIKTREKIINTISLEVFEITHEIDNSRLTIYVLQEDLRKLKEDYAANIVASYKKRQTLDRLIFIFDSKTFNQAFNRIKYLKQYSNFRQKQAQLIIKTQKEILNVLNQMLAIKQEKLNLVGMQENHKKELEKDKKVESTVLVTLKGKEKDLRVQITEAEKAANRLTKAIKDLIAKEIEAARIAEEARVKRERARLAAKNAKNNTEEKPVESGKKSAPAFLSPEAIKLSSDFEANRGKLPWPVDKGFISGSFGTHSHPTLKGIKINNNGINISTGKSSSVKCIFKGTVKAIFSVPGMEKVIMVNHGEYYSVYANMENVSVKIGQEINTNDVIGSVYTDEEMNKTEVHLEIYKQKQMLDPEEWLRN